MKVKLLTVLIGTFLITVNTANADFPYPPDNAPAAGTPPNAASAAAQGDIVDSGGNLKIMPPGSQRKMIGPPPIQPDQMSQGQMPQGQMPQGQMPQGQMPQGQMPLGQMPQGQVPNSASSQNMPMPGGR